MRVAVSVLTYNPRKNGRWDLFERTLESLRAGGSFDLFIVDNGSVDGTAEWVDERGGYVNRSSLHTSAHGNNLGARILAGSDADICVLSDDDVEWSESWVDELAAWWSAAPDDIAITGCHVEPNYPWNTLLGTVDVAGRRGLIRASTGAASWSYRQKHYGLIFPMPQQVQGWGDVPTCDKVQDAGYRIAQIDLARHIGEGQSTWGNQSHRYIRGDAA